VPQQVAHLATLCGEDGVRPASVNGVYESDAVLADDLRTSLLEALRPLEDVPEDQRDWHPGSDQQVCVQRRSR
jgi:Protein of unknown function (DUF4246)